MLKDQVCGMEVDPKKVAGKSDYNGETVYFCSLTCKQKFDHEPERFAMKGLDEKHMPGGKGMEQAAPGARETAKDPVCGMVVEKGKSLKKELGGRMFYFCSDGCLRTFESPEEELKKMKRIMGRELPGAPHEVLLVLDATTGQNAIAQARAFTEAVGVTGIALTKLDGTARGGIAVAIEQELDIPIKLIGVGEQVEDLLSFDAEVFVDALLGGS